MGNLIEKNYSLLVRRDINLKKLRNNKVQNFEEIECYIYDLFNVDKNKLKEEVTFNQLNLNSITFIKHILELEIYLDTEFDIKKMSMDAFSNLNEFVLYCIQLSNK